MSFGHWLGNAWNKVKGDVKSNPWNYAFPVMGLANMGSKSFQPQSIAGKFGLAGTDGSGAPKPPDFMSAADKQGAANQKVIDTQTQANRPNQIGPFGSTQWSQGPNGQWTQNTSLNGPLGSAASGLMSQAARDANTPMMTGEDARKQAIDASYGQATSRLDPQWQQRAQQNKSELAAQGFDSGSEGYNNEMGNFNRGRNDAYSSAMNSAIGQGAEAQQAVFNQNMAQRQMPYQQLGALQGLTQQQNFTPAGAAQPAPYFPAAAANYQGQLQSYGIDQAQQNSWMNGMGQMAPFFAKGFGGMGAGAAGGGGMTAADFAMMA